MSPTLVRILIVDDHPLMRTGLAAVLEEVEALQVVGQATNGCEAIEVYRRLLPDIVLMDIQMPEMDGISATRTICREFPDAKIIVFTTYRGDVQARDALIAGAKAYLLKSAIRTELIDAVRAVSSGKRYIAADVARDLAEHMESASLSSRERQVIACIAAGNSNKRAAGLLGISEDTVKNHVKSILGKLGATDRTHAINIAYRRGILPPT